MRVLAGVLLVVWLALGGFTGPYAGKLSEVAENDSSAFLPNSAESTQVAELQKKFQREEAIPAIVVVERSGGLTEDDKKYLAEQAKGFQASPVIPAPNDNEAAQLVVLLDPAKDVKDSVFQLRDGARGAPEGLTVLVTGPAAQVADLVEAFGGIDGLLLVVAAAVVALILLVVYRSPILPVVVLVSAVFALGLASFVVYLLAKNDVLALNGQSQGILSILVVGAATDYALLLVSRFREELRDSEDRVAAIRAAWRGTIEPIAASAGTVILGVLCLLFSDLDSNKGLGPVAAIGIGAALITTMTFLPAVLALLGRAAFWPFAPKFGSGHPETSGLWGRTANFVRSKPRAIWVVSTLVLLVGAAFLPQLKASGTAQSDVFLTEVESVAGQEVLSRHFPGGTGSPTIIIAQEAEAAEVLRKAEVDGVAEVRPAGTADGLVSIQATLADAPDSDAAVATVQRIRDAVRGTGEAKVGGPTATLLDTRTTSEHDRTLIIPIVLVVIFLILAVLLRSLLAPLLLIATVVLSFAATMGVSALVFNHVFDFPGSDPVVPLFGFVFLVALGIDYNIFLMTRVREETRRLGTVEGTIRGLSLTGGVITSAGVVLAATFAALAVLPILFLTQIAFIVAFGVLLDTLLVRSLLVPALSVDIGGRIWWPSKLR
ncbi:MMPL family transporter [Lentzea jiangxiensis]|uniref:Putative drug exporter of the RND superfamily n=1 Tax=Lentzea jiangxiensis TaxID=641025 RepID=A0A1H0S4M1_9PSEU|nr:MMPL family transporter [Lentzea jiangxiensis]SDP36186.1 putative drug exporter of the RND superfamily [Lentzea jiangxiensis]